MSKYKQLMLMVPGMEKREDKMDFYRSLSVQGVYQTVCVAEKIKEDSCENPEFIFAATALYMQQTAEVMHQTFPSSKLILRDNLYAANEKILLHLLTHLDDIFECLLILAESKPIHKLIVRLAGQKMNLIPSSCICMRWPACQSWKTINENKGKMIRTWIP